MIEQVQQKINAYTTVLKKRGIPKNFVEAMMVDIANTAIKEGRDLKFERIYTAMALALRNKTKDKKGKRGWGGKRICSYLQEFTDIVQACCDEDVPWEVWMEKLDAETGIIIRQGDTEDRLICEYTGRDIKRIKEILEAERREKENGKQLQG